MGGKTFFNANITNEKGVGINSDSKDKKTFIHSRECSISVNYKKYNGDRDERKSLQE